MDCLRKSIGLLDPDYTITAQLAEKRTVLTITRTIYSEKRTDLAGSLTYLALIRAEVAFTTMAISLFRQFGVSWRTLFDAGMGIASIVATLFDMIGYTRTVYATKYLDLGAAEHETGQPDLKMLKA